MEKQEGQQEGPQGLPGSQRACEEWTQPRRTEGEDEEDIIVDDDSESGEVYPEGTKVGPLNALFMAQKEKYDRIFVRVSHDRLMPALAGANLNDIVPEPTPGTSDGCPKVRLQILYAAKQTSVASASEDKVTWKPLNFIDRTKLKGKDDSSFYKSGEIILS